MQRTTRQAVTIRDVLQRSAAPLSVDSILDQARRELPGLGIATVYRCVRALCDEGWLKPVLTPKGTVCYEPSDRGHHHFFHCRMCERLFTIDRCPTGMDGLAPKGFVAEGHEIVVTGLCNTCTLPKVAVRGQTAKTPDQRANQKLRRGRLPGGFSVKPAT